MAEEKKTPKKHGGCTGKGFTKENPRPGPGHPPGVPNITSRFKANIEKFSKMKLPTSIAMGLRQRFPDIPKDCTIEEAEAIVVHNKALLGESWAYDRMHGKAAQSVDLTTNGNDLPAPPSTLTIKIAKD